jgi:hypothetical protein
MIYLTPKTAKPTLVAIAVAGRYFIPIVIDTRRLEGLQTTLLNVPSTNKRKRKQFINK